MYNTKATTIIQRAKADNPNRTESYLYVWDWSTSITKAISGNYRYSLSILTRSKLPDAQANQILPNELTQQSNRNFHLCFQPNKQALQYPVQINPFYQLLTFQGEKTYSDIPVESNPTQLLPHLQLYQPR